MSEQENAIKLFQQRRDDLSADILTPQSIDKTPETVRKQVEAHFLRPPTKFNDSLLQQLQSVWSYEPTSLDLFHIPDLSLKRTLKFKRRGLSGEIVGHEEKLEPINSLRPDNSSSFRREPAPRDAFVRGKGNFFPFAPGGLAIDATISKQLDNAEKLAQLSINDLSYRNQAPGMPTTPEPETSAVEEVDDFLPAEITMPTLQPATRIRKPKEKLWAHMVDVNRPMDNFRELVPELAYEHPFELDTFQKEAVYHLEQAECVFVAAHTSAGKTVVAEYAIALAEKHMTRAIYTSPIKALSNQKYRDFRQTFDSVGILTGDVQLNPEATCLIMTTEILRSMLYRGADLIRDVEFVIFDEVHYVNDQERGVVWEEVIIMLPEHITLILLSATVPNTFEFANWVGRTKQKDIYVISTLKRPIPLEHYLYANKKMFKIVDADKKWNAIGYKEATGALVRNKEAKPVVATGRGRGANRGSGQARGGAATRGGTQPFVRGGTMKTMERHDRNIWIHLVGHLNKAKLLPCVIFVFSKKRCEENAGILSNIDLCTSVEKSQIHITIEKALARLRFEDRSLPQIIRMKELLSRGIAVHHGGLLPIVKEMVEILFSRTLVKVLFATETFAMGVNMPAKSVVFSGVRKHDGHGFRDLTPGEYTQMAGRAGRRGLDPTGTVIIACGDEAPDQSTLSTMLLGQPFKLSSQFRLTYNMILNLLRVETLQIEEMIRRSFSENASQTLLPEQQRLVEASQKKLTLLQSERGEQIKPAVRKLHDACIRFQELQSKLFPLAYQHAGRRYFGAGRVIVVQTADAPRTLAVLVGEASTSTPRERTFTVLLAKKTGGKRESDLLPFVPVLRHAMHKLTVEGLQLDIVPMSAINWMTKTVLKLDPMAIRQRIKSAWDAAQEQMIGMSDMQDPALDAMDMTKIRDLNFGEQLKALEALRFEIETSQALQEEDLVKQYRFCQEEYMLNQQILLLKSNLSNQNLELLPDYEQRVMVLQDLGFIDATHAVQLKGRVACEINSAHELILTELILDNALAEFECEEIVALLSAFVFEERTDNEPNLTPHLQQGKDMVIAMARRVNEVQEHHQVLTAGSGDNFEDSPRFGLMEVCYEWARGLSFGQITELTDVLEGTIVRCIVRLDEVLRECQSAAKTVGDAAMYTKLETCRELIKRDVVFSASLFW
ncbi:antiviral helicase SKI2 [Protomyces lactucae-debilis]|uniref:Antiviral helicase SKI2 n=1 Tax=Protomyces lactucae-debilis TaxID=2754530 RepID=A0A1Y2F8U3_PROLT|nr:antiviral helicase SKI2 [Protomyces lactucae-debilis]ORY79874.1 antiviral helicase SKI2 [Protomyces lactucae-debilis]